MRSSRALFRLWPSLFGALVVSIWAGGGVQAASADVISGRVYNLTTGQGYSGVTISLCNAGSTRTGTTGNWQLVVPFGTSYCARVVAGAPAGLVGPKTRNNPEIGAFPSYENQVSGVNAYHNLAYPVLFQRWDRSIDAGFDFAYVQATPRPVTSPPAAAPVAPTPPPIASPAAIASPTSSPSPSPTASSSPIAASLATPSPSPQAPPRAWFKLSDNDIINLAAILSAATVVGLAAAVIPIRAIRRRRYQEYLRSKYYDL